MSFVVVWKLGSAPPVSGPCPPPAKIALFECENVFLAQRFGHPSARGDDRLVHLDEQGGRTVANKTIETALHHLVGTSGLECAEWRPGGAMRRGGRPARGVGSRRRPAPGLAPCPCTCAERRRHARTSSPRRVSREHDPRNCDPAPGASRRWVLASFIRWSGSTPKAMLPTSATKPMGGSGCPPEAISIAHSSTGFTVLAVGLTALEPQTFEEVAASVVESRSSMGSIQPFSGWRILSLLLISPPRLVSKLRLRRVAEVNESLRSCNPLKFTHSAQMKWTT